MTPILVYCSLTGFTDVHNRNHHPRKAAEPRLFSEALVQASWTNTSLQLACQMQLKAIANFEDFRELLAVTAVWKYLPHGKRWCLIVTDKSYVDRLYICSEDIFAQYGSGISASEISFTISEADLGFPWQSKLRYGFTKLTQSVFNKKDFTSETWSFNTKVSDLLLNNNKISSQNKNRDTSGAYQLFMFHCCPLRQAIIFFLVVFFFFKQKSVGTTFIKSLSIWH